MTMKRLYDDVTNRVVNQVYFDALAGKKRHEIDPMAYRIIADAFNLEYVLQAALDDVKIEEQHFRMGTANPEELHELGLFTQAEEMASLCNDALTRVQEVELHRCEFTADDWCPTCGLDGRA